MHYAIRRATRVISGFLGLLLLGIAIYLAVAESWAMAAFFFLLAGGAELTWYALADGLDSRGAGMAAYAGLRAVVRGLVRLGRKVNAAPLILSGVAFGAAGFLVFYFGARFAEAAWYTVIEGPLRPLVGELLGYGLYIAAAVPAAMLAVCVAKFFTAPERRGNVALATLASLAVWSIMSYGMFFAYVAAFLFWKGADPNPNPGTAIPVFLLSAGYVLIGCGLILWILRGARIPAADISADAQPAPARLRMWD